MDRFRGIKVTRSWQKLFQERGVTRLWVEGWRFLENWAAIVAADQAGIEIWLRGETNDLRPRTGVREQVRRLLLGALFRRVRYFLCIGTANRRFYRSFGIGEESLKAAPYCVDNNWFRQQAEASREKRHCIRRKWLIPDETFCLLFCGKFIAKKRPLDVVKACRRILESHPHRRLHLLFVGSGQAGMELRSACRVMYDSESEVPEQPQDWDKSVGLPAATFAGFLNQSEITSAYVAADCLVLPSDAGETWGLVVNEAMSTGLPCIASNQCGCAEDLVKPLSESAVFPMGDIEALSRAIIAQISNPPAALMVMKKADDHAIAITIRSVVELAGCRRG